MPKLRVKIPNFLKVQNLSEENWSVSCKNSSQNDEFMNNLEIVLVFLLKTEIRGKNNELNYKNYAIYKGVENFFL